MSGTTDRWVLTFPGPRGAHSQQASVVVEDQGVLGPNGHRVFADASGKVRAEITDDGLVLMLATDDLPDPVHPGNPVHAQPLP